LLSASWSPPLFWGMVQAVVLDPPAVVLVTPAPAPEVVDVEDVFDE